MQRVLHVVGARPNFIKMAPIMRVMGETPSEFQQVLVHTGQHYDKSMSQVFFDELSLPHPDINLQVGSGSHAQQTAQIMARLEPVLLDYKPDWVVVPGDVNSTLASALVAAKLGIKVAHVEAGLRSFDRSMPEEINRLLTDQLSDLLLTTSIDGTENLLREGIAKEKIHFVGNVMIDTLIRLRPIAEPRWHRLREQFGLDKYILVTLHRPANVDRPEVLAEIIAALDHLCHKIQVIFPVHPRTRQYIDSQYDLDQSTIRFLQPLGYLDFLALEAHATLVLTDSGGVQEETTWLGVPCLTVRPNTERPVTITHGTNQLIGHGTNAITEACNNVLIANTKTEPKRKRPELWDGMAARRIVEVLQRTR